MENTRSLLAGGMNYEPIKEQLYDFEHPLVKKWTDYFQDLTAEREIFKTFELATVAGGIRKAELVGISWHAFSTYMPWFLCQASAMMTDNVKRHYAIQTAFEELGMRDVNTIHCDWFWQTCDLTGLKKDSKTAVKIETRVEESLRDLTGFLNSASSDIEVMGLMLGLEIPAEENIETVFSAMSYSSEIKTQLEEHDFFKMHRMIEIEHVRLNVSNFLRFCPSDELKEQYLKGFHKGLDFWDLFWSRISWAFTRSLSKSA